MFLVSEVAQLQASSVAKPSVWPYYFLFFVSGFPALIYQIVWQRALFTIYGVNIESVTIIVTMFMLGLGLGSLGGGRLSKITGLPLLGVFGAIEIGIGLFGAISLLLFHRVALVTAGASAPKTALFTMCMLLFPTLLMGSTLPLLVAHFVRITGNVGESVGGLYAGNTFGSAVACVIAAVFTMRLFGESGSVQMAAATNMMVGGSAWLLHIFRARRAEPALDRPTGPGASRALAFSPALMLSALTGFIALGYEMVWYRLYSFVSGTVPACFALLLGFYLGGVAYGALFVRDLCHQKLRDNSERTAGLVGTLLVWAGVASFLVAPGLAAAVPYVPYLFTFPLIFVCAALLGATFPLVSHAAIDPNSQAGSKLSYVYLANILGSASGSFVVGFVLMDRWSLRTISSFLLGLGVMAGAILLPRAHRRAKQLILFGSAAAVVLALLSPWLFSQLYEKLLYKEQYTRDIVFGHVVETRSGVITVTQDGVVFGGGAYDGRFNTDLNHDTNGIVRAFAVSGFHPHPSEVLMIGLSSGSWAQVIANFPGVTHLTIVEINPGYLDLIPRYPNVASVLANPKVQVVIDDGRRWLARNPGRKFDLIVMNTTIHWRANVSNLLSMEFLALVRTHLKPGGVHYYNTTLSEEALLTGATVFPHSLRVMNFLAVSDSPIQVDRRRWEQELSRYRIAGKLMFDPGDPAQSSRLGEVLSLVDTLRTDRTDEMSMEWGDSLRRRLQGRQLVTDDNMATEWH